jgi:5-hydroxyisourate hydrolase
MTFHTAEYFRTHAARGFYPYVSVVFEIHSAGEHYHVPLLLSPFGYSTYRGS